MEKQKFYFAYAHGQYFIGKFNNDTLHDCLCFVFSTDEETDELKTQLANPIPFRLLNKNNAVIRPVIKLDSVLYSIDMDEIKDNGQMIEFYLKNLEDETNNICKTEGA